MTQETQDVYDKMDAARVAQEMHELRVQHRDAVSAKLIHELVIEELREGLEEIKSLASLSGNSDIYNKANNLLKRKAT